MRRFALAALAMATLCGASHAEEETMTGWGAGLSARPAKPMIIVPPDYPKEALAKGSQATVDVSGTVTKDGFISNPRYKASLDDPSFEKEIHEVLKYWMFNSPIADDECVPKDGEATIRVWFEIAEGKPKVSISMEPFSEDFVRDNGMKAYVKAVNREQPVYPVRAIKRGIAGAIVVAISKVGLDGKVEKVSFQNTRADETFRKASEHALRQWTYDVGPPEAFKDRPWVCVEHTLRFVLTN